MIVRRDYYEASSCQDLSDWQNAEFAIVSTGVVFRAVVQRSVTYSDGARCRLLRFASSEPKEAENWEAGENPALPPQR